MACSFFRKVTMEADSQEDRAHPAPRILPRILEVRMTHHGAAECIKIDENLIEEHLMKC